MSTVNLSEILPGLRTEHPHVLVQNGVPTVSNSRIPVRLIAQLYRAGDSVEDILQSYPHLGAAAVHDALSYYLDHTQDIEREIAAQRVEQVLGDLGGQVDERGFISLTSAAKHA